MPVRAFVSAGYRTPRSVQEMRSSKVFQGHSRVSRDPNFTGPVQSANRKRKPQALPYAVACPNEAVAGETITVRVEDVKPSHTVGAVLLPSQTDQSLVTWSIIKSRPVSQGTQQLRSTPELQLRLRHSSVMTVGEARRRYGMTSQQAYVEVFGSYYQRDEAWRRDESLVAFEATAVAEATGEEGEEGEEETSVHAVELGATITQAGRYDVYIYAEDAEGYRHLLPCSPLPLSVSAHSEPCLEASSVAKASQHVGRLYSDGAMRAGEAWEIEIRVCDAYGNLTAPRHHTDLVVSHGHTSLALDRSCGDDIRVSRCTLYPTEAGDHCVRAYLCGVELPGSPVECHVVAGPVCAPRCSLAPAGIVQSAPPDCGGGFYRPRYPAAPWQFPTNSVCELVLIVRDRFGNRHERGGIRVDARVGGPGVSCCMVEDRRDGSYSIRVTGYVPGEMRLCARVDSVELLPVSMAFVREENRLEQQAERDERLRCARLAAAHVLTERGVSEEGLRERIVELAGLW